MPAASAPADKLPKFKKPPVVEVAASVQFAALEQLGAAHVSELWNSFDRSKYPKYRELATLGKSELPTPGKVIQQPNLKFEFLEKPELCRQWFMSADETALIQFQRDRLTYNWRKPEEKDGGFSEKQTYPHYDFVKEKFFLHLGQLANFLREKKLENIEISLLELAYVNIISLAEIKGDLKNIGSVFRDLGWDKSERFLASPSKIQMLWQYDLSEIRSIGQVKLSTAQNTKNGEIAHRLELNVIGHPADKDEAAAKKWFDDAHKWIVTSFNDLLTREVQERWGLYYG